MRKIILTIIDGAAGFGFALFGVLLLVFPIGSVIGGSSANPVALLFAVVGIAAIGAALESWFGWNLRWRPVWIVGAAVVGYLVLAFLALQNIGP